MGYRSLAECIDDLRAHGHLVEIDREVDPHLEAAAIQRRVYEAGGPALLFPRVKGTAFPMVGNLFGTMERTHYIFRDTLEAVRHLVELKVRPPAALQRPWRYRGVPRTALHLLARRVARYSASSKASTTLSASSFCTTAIISFTRGASSMHTARRGVRAPPWIHYT